jgi:uncharacterized membrane protein
MVALLLAATAFLALHVGLSAPALRPRLVGALGEARFRGLYSLAALITLALMVWAYVRAPVAPMWEPVGGTRWIAIALMPLATILLVAGVSQPNPTSVAAAGAPATGEPKAALRITRHPVMWAFGIWGVVHLLVAGTTRALLFFGALAALALLGTERIDGKHARRAPDEHARLVAATSNVPFLAILDRRQSLGAALAEIGAARLAGGIALYLALLVAHPWIAGRAVL